MPSKSPEQAKLMKIAAHTKGGYGGVPEKVGAEFEAADEARKVNKRPASETKMRNKRYGKADGE